MLRTYMGSVGDNVKETSGGFTIVEVIVTLVVTSLFIWFFFQSYIVMESRRIAVAQRAIASDVAYTNLQKFSIRTPLMNDKAICNNATMDITTTNAQTKDGLLLGNESNTTLTSIYGFMAETGDAVAKLSNPVKQTVLAYATHGCAGDNFTEYPLMIVSKVKYGNNNEEVSHASFIK